tara:strand:- start:127 stop:1005 length:879 start_codon:yes stop_codon:yes gene_type:complete
MNIQTAQTILQLPPNFAHTDIKKQYHKLSLKYHPDKNKSANANEKFQEINRAYRFLSDNEVDGRSIPMNYDDILFSLINMTYKNQNVNKDLFNFIRNIIANYPKFSQSTLNDISSEVLINCYKFMNQNKDELGIPPHVMNVLNAVMKKRENIVNIQIVTPSLVDMYDSNILKLSYKNDMYLIPLWHAEVSFDVDGDEDDLDITCIPKLPEHMSIDNNNNLHIYIRSKIESLLNRETLDLNIDIKNISILIKDLKIIKHQTIVYEGQGIPRIDEKNIYNNEHRGDIIVHLELY